MVALPAALVVAAAGFGLYGAARKAVRQIAGEDLGGVAKLHVQQIESWLAVARRNATLVTKAPHFTADLRAWQESGMRDDRLRQLLLATLDLPLHDVRRVDLRSAADGALLLTTNPDGLPADDASRESAAARATASGGEPLLDGLHVVGSGAGRRVALNLFAPIRDAGGKTMAVAVLALDPEADLFHPLQQWPGTSSSAETVLVGLDGTDIVFLNTLRHSNSPAMSVRLPRTMPKLLASQAVRGFAGVVSGTDYRGIPTIGYVLPVPGTPWFVISKADQDEIYSALNTGALIVAALGAVLFLVVVRWLAQRQADAARIERLLRLKATLSAVNGGIVECETLDDLFFATCRACVEHGGFKLAWVGAADADGQRIVMRQAWGNGLDYLAGLRISVSPALPEGRGPTARAFRDRRPYICNDFAKDAATAPWRSRAQQHGLRSSMALPIYCPGVFHGVLTAYGGEANTFDEDAGAVMEEIAGSLSFAIGHLASEEAKRAMTAALKEREARLNEAQRIGRIGHWTFDLASRHITWSPEMFRLYERDPMLGPADLAALSAGLTPEALEELRKAIRRVVRTGKRVVLEQRVSMPAGAIAFHDCVIAPVRDDRGRVTSLQGTVQDVTERKLAEQKLIKLAQDLERAAAEVSDLYEHAPCGYHSLDATGVIRRVNDTELKWLGYERAELVGQRKLSDLMTADSMRIFERTFPRFVEVGQVRDLEVELVRKDGTVLPVMISATALRDADGRFLLSRSTVYDMSERKAMELERANYAYRIEVLSRDLVAVQEDVRRRLAGDLHDRTSPNLAAIALNLDVIAAALPAKEMPDVAARLEDTRALIEDTTASVRDICADLRPVVLDHAGLLPALEGYAQQFSRRTGIAVKVDCAGIGPNGRLAPETESLLFRLVQEALTNCAKHSRATAANVSMRQDGRHIVLTVADNGVGFQVALPDRHRWPSGLGILTMREIAEFAGGRFEIESSPGKGTCIRVEL